MHQNEKATNLSEHTNHSKLINVIEDYKMKFEDNYVPQEEVEFDMSQYIFSR